MPDINLQDEGSMDNLESSAEHVEETIEGGEEAPKKKSGIGTILIVVLAVLIVGGGGVFVLDKLGVVHIFSKKKAPPTVAQLPEEQAPQQAAPDPSASEPSKMIETPPVSEKGKPASTAKKSVSKEQSEVPPKPMPAPTSSGNLQEMKGEYTVQVSAWRDKEMAGEIVKRLTDAGYPAFVEDRDFKGGMWYTVRVGRYSSRKDAEQAVQSFAEELRSNYWIDKAKAK